MPKKPVTEKKTTTKKQPSSQKTAEVSKTDYTELPKIKPRDIATAQIWVMAAVLYFILAFYEIFYRGDWFAGVLNILLGAIFTSFAWQNETK